LTKQVKKRYDKNKVDESHRKPKRPTVIYLQTGDLDITAMQGADLDFNDRVLKSIGFSKHGDCAERNYIGVRRNAL